MPGSKDRDVFVRIKPAFDYHLSPADATYRTSVAPYRYTEAEYVDRATGTPMFTPWYLTAIAYAYFGASKQGIISPLTLQGLGADLPLDEMACAIFDCQQKARNSDRPDWKALTEGSDRSGPVLPYKSAIVLYNASISYNGKAPFDGIFISKPTALETLKDQLDWPLVHGMQPLTEDPNSPFARYLFGDFTHPVYGLAAKVWLTEGKTNKAMKSYCMHLSNKEYSRDAMIQAPLGNDMQSINNSLHSRHILGSDQTLKIMTYQEMVDFLVFDGAVPYELILQACSGRANVPPPPRASYGTGSTSLPQVGQFPQTHQAGAALPDNPTRMMHIQHQGQIFQVPLGELRNWLAASDDASILVKPADNAHDWTPHGSSPIVHPPLALPGPAMGQPLTHGSPFGSPGVDLGNGAAAGFGAGAPATSGGNPFGATSPAAQSFGQAASPFAQQAAAAPMQQAAPQAAPQVMQGQPQGGNPFAAGGSAPATNPFGAAMGAVSQPQSNPFAGETDGIPGLRPENGGPTGPSVATVGGAQPTPVGVPTSGISGPLTPEEAAELQALTAKEVRTATETSRVLELSNRGL